MTIPSHNGSTCTVVTSTNTLQNMVQYTLKASGDIQLSFDVMGQHHRADAEYRWLGPTDEPHDFSSMSGIDIGLKFGTTCRTDITTPHWGDYRSDHIYTIPYTGQGTPVSIYFQDGYYPDNDGSLTVEIYQGTPSPAYTPPSDSCECQCGDEESDMIESDPGTCDTPSDSSSAPVRYFDGTVKMQTTDLRSSGFGKPWGQTRSWSNAAGYSPQTIDGVGNVITQLPSLQLVSGNPDPLMGGNATLALVSNGSTARYFNQFAMGETYTANFFSQETLTHYTSSNRYILADTRGNQLTFFDFSSGTAAGKKGQLETFADPYGGSQNTMSVSRGGDGTVNSMSRTTTSGSNTITESYLLSYIASPGINSGFVKNEKLQLQINTAITVVRQVAYSYYDGSTTDGDAGTLQSATVQDGALTPNNLDTTYYRYYQAGDANGYADGLKYMFSPRSFARLVAHYQVDPRNPLTPLTDLQVAPYADVYFQYYNQYPPVGPSSHPVKQEIVQAAGASGTGGGLGKYTYSYLTGTATGSDLYNTWRYRTIETLPDSVPGVTISQNIVYANKYGQPMMKIYESGPTGNTTRWATYYKYGNAGQVIMQAHPSAVITKDGMGNNINFEPYADLVNGGLYLQSNSGLVEITDYGIPVQGSNALYYLDTKLQRGQNAASQVIQRAVTYLQQSVGGVTIYPVASSTVYRNGTSSCSDPTNCETTSYTYHFYFGTDRMSDKTVTKPVILTTQNGPTTPAADVEQTFYDTYGRQTWHRNSINATGGNADGYIDYTEYDAYTGAVTKTIQDVQIDAGHSGDYQNPPAGWTTPPGGGLHLLTSFQVDTLGRVTKRTDPVPNPNPLMIPPNITYTVYKDSNWEVRTYPGWLPAAQCPATFPNGCPTGPTRITRQDRASDPSYDETLTTSDPPNASGGTPNGGENVTYTNVQTLTRSYTNAGGQLDHTDAYFSTVGMTTYPADSGMLGANFYRTSYTYDTRGRQNQVTSPTNTITQTDYDGLSRPIDVKVGTTTGTPVTVSQIQYDQDLPYSIGDGDLTQVTQMPGGSAAARVTRNWYDWRDRQVITKSGVQASEQDGTHRTLLVSSFDNLNEVVTWQQYDGDGVTVTFTAGVPVLNFPAWNPTPLRAQTVTQFDNQRRVFQTKTFSVDQSNGTVSPNSLITNNWYDHRGNLIKTSQPGGQVTKTTYDGANRATVVYTTDEIMTPTWEDASVVTSNIVLSQTETTYDANSNPTLVTQRDRFHDAVITGALQNPSTDPKARVSYVASYFDAANRLTASVNAGTYGGSTYTPPTMPPIPPDPSLVTSYGYKADAVQQVSIVGSPSSGSFTLTYTTPDGLTMRTTTGITWPTTAAAIQSALQTAIGGTGPVLVTGLNNGPWLVRFAGSQAGQSQRDLSGDASLLMCAPACSVSVMTTSKGGDAGRVATTIDPRRITSKTDFDLLGRTVRTVAGFSTFVPSDTSDQTTEYTYDGSNHVLTLTAKLANNGAETTSYTYGVTNMNCGTTGSCLYSNDLLFSVAYPGQPSQLEKYAYNALSETAIKTDRNQTVHNYTYDVLGRLVTDAVTPGSGVDGTVRSLGYTFDTGGRPFQFTSYNSTGGVINQVQRSYNGLSQLTTEYQEHSGAVNTGTSLNVQYAYSEMAGGANHSRMVSMTYPNLRQVNYNYAAGIDDRISRLTSLQNNGAPLPLEVYSYLGLGTMVKRAHPEPAVDLTYIGQAGDPACIPGVPPCDAGDQYRGLDRFGRVVDQRWIPSANPSMPTDRYQYGYDRDSNRQFRDNLVSAVFGELYHVGGSIDTYDASGNLLTTGYDLLNRLPKFGRGQLNGARTDFQTAPSHTQQWGLDAVGNWKMLTTDGGTPQNRMHNVQNQITSIDSGLVTPTYDNNGNTTKDETGKVYTYDGWNRLVTVVTPNNIYSYDALGRRITTAYGFQLPTDLFYSSAWQVLEERLQGSPTFQYVWSPVYVDALVERDANGGPRLYVQQDANWNVTGVISSAGAVQEHFAYDPYGKASVYDLNWIPTADTLNWVYLHQGGRYDGNSGLYNFRNRDYSPTLGRWLQEDPTAYDGVDANLYSYLRNAPTSGFDSSGLQKEDFNLSFENVVDPKGGKYGAFIWGINWKLDKKANEESGGMIIQHVQVTRHIKYVSGMFAGRPASHPLLDKVGEQYYEAWQVKPGEQVTDQSSPASVDPRSIKIFNDDGIMIDVTKQADDWFFLPQAGRDEKGNPLRKTTFNNTSGNIEIFGQAAYFDCMQVKELKDFGFKQGNPYTGAGGLLFYAVRSQTNINRVEKLLGDWKKGKSEWVTHTLFVSWEPNGKTTAE